ncbi:MAG: hypothetical protein AB7O26_13470 [Planctomycetaceae bacterium]
MQFLTLRIPAASLLLLFALSGIADAAEPKPLRLSWKKNMLSISGEQVPGGAIQVHYLEAYCRPGSTDRDWSETTIGHTTRLTRADENGQKIQLECRLKDGVVVDHTIVSSHDEVRFLVVAKNPTDKVSDAYWAQPCMRVDKFTGRNQQTYLEKAFIFLDGKPARMPTPNWATKPATSPVRSGARRVSIGTTSTRALFHPTFPRTASSAAIPPTNRRSSRWRGSRIRNCFRE